MKILRGHHNESTILFCGIETNALFDSGSQVTTVTEEYYRYMNPRLVLYTTEDLNFDLNAADGNKIPLFGAIESIMEVPFLPTREIQVPVEVLPSTDFGFQIPVIVGTNTINKCRERRESDTTVTGV